MVLLVGQSANNPTADQQAVLARLKAVRQQPAFRNLKIGMMHWDRPNEARYAQRYLGVQSSQLPCLVLAQVNAKGQPVRSLYSIPRVTRNQLDQVEAMAQAWARANGQVVSGNSDRIMLGQLLSVNGSLRSPNGVYVLTLQGDGNLVIARQGAPIWSSDTQGQGGTRLGLSDDGALRLVTGDGRPVWQAPGTGGKGLFYFQMQDDGNAVVYRQDPGGPVPVWSSASAGR